MIKEGSKAPTINLKNQENKPWKATKSNKFTVLYFYPKDDTPGCTLEGKEFTKHLPKFKSLKTEVVGISGGTTTSKEKFCKKYNLDITLLSDEDFKIAKSFGAYGEKSFMGRKYLGIHRYTYVIDSAGKVVKVFTQVKPGEHAQEVLEFLKTGKSKSTTIATKKTATKKSTPKKTVTPKKAVKKSITKKASPKPAIKSKSKNAKKR